MSKNIIYYKGPSNERKEEIAELANCVINEYSEENISNPEHIVKKAGITISYGNYQDAFDGLLECYSKRFHIYCNLDRLELKSNPRTMFTIAHELGHFFITEHRLALLYGNISVHGSFTEYQSNNYAEMEADCFASNLLMPKDLFVKAAKSEEIGLTAILSLSKKFKTSITSTAIRYVSLDIASCLIIKWTSEKYQWKWLSTKTRNANYRKTIDDTSQILSGSATAKALSNEKIPDCGFFQNGTTAEAWFPFVSTSCHRNIILIEQAIPLGRFGVLTFIYPESNDFPAINIDY